MADLRIVDAPVLLQESITDDVKMPTGGLGNFSIRLGDIVWYVVTKEQLANKNYVDTSSKGVKDKLDEHIADKANPHKVTKEQVGLGNVDNTADIDKPVSNATKSAIITATTDMATKAYVNSKDGDLSTLKTADKTNLVKAINEVVSVKANKADVALSISNLIDNKADKATTLAGYGIIDAYTKSEIDTNYGGVKTLYDKNVEAGAGANGWTASLVVDASGKTQQQINNSQLRKEHHVLDLGMKMDGSDETDKLNDIIATLDNSKLVIGGGNLRVSKTAKYASGYPKNDQPCIAILDKTNLTIEIASGTTISVNEHGQSIFEMMRCKNTTIINNGILKGAGNFPLLDGTTGYAEKGSTTQGYPTSPGFYKNNSLDTSANTDGGYGHNFPQWGGGTASTWGKWNGGFIGNEGYGVLIHNDCNRCGVTGIGEVVGFNGSGIQIGFNGSYQSPSLNYPASEQCFVIGQTVHDCYTQGIAHVNCKNTIITKNHVYNIGHPQAKDSDVAYDPGYGIVTGFSLGTNAENALITDNYVHHCNRKGIDLHSGINYTIADNKVTDCRVVGIFVAQGDVANVYTRNNKILRNTIIKCGTAPASNIYQNLGGIQIYNLIGSRNDVEVIDNTLLDCVSARGAINIDAGTHNIVRGNTIRGSNYATDTAKFSAISVGAYSGVQTVSSTIVEDNYIVTNNYMVKGITTNNGSGLIKDNLVVLDGVPGWGFEQIVDAQKFDFIGNHVTANTAATAYVIEKTSGIKLRNTATLTTGAALGLNTTKNLGEPLIASCIVNFNNTDSPTLTVINGGNIIDGLSASNYGVQLNLKNLNTTDKVIATVSRLSSEGLVSGSGNVNYIYIRAANPSFVLLGLQTAPATSHIQTRDVVRGNFRIDITITN